MIRYCFLLLVLVFPLVPWSVVAQEAAPAPDRWNSDRALELIRRAQARRHEASVDTGLVNYQADARLYAYFYLDRQDTGERNLVKTDQLALEVFWAEPDLVKQRIVGWRDEESLPTNIRYHLDHLTVVQENFGDLIHLGDGDEVQGVLHPAAPGAEDYYEYRLADSLTLRLPGAAEPVRVYELQVRPRDLDQPGFLGSVFVDRRAGDLVRLDFTFTPSAYRDPRLDHISISLENALWKGRFWLPNRQQVEIRREIQQLDIPAGSVIRATMRIGNYRLNEPLPRGTFAGPRVVAAPEAEREAFPFDQGLHAEVREEGIGPQAELSDVREVAAELAREQLRDASAGVRLLAPAVSELVRYNRAEGAVVGLGISAHLPPVRTTVRAGWAFGAEHPLGSVRLESTLGATRVHGRLYGNQPRDVGIIRPVASGALNTLSSLFAAEDFTDPYYASGAEVGLQRSLSPSWSVSSAARIERQRSAELEADFSLAGGGFRPVRPIDEEPSGGAGTFLGGSLQLERAAPFGTARWWTTHLRVEGGVLNPGGAELPACVPEDVLCADRQNAAFIKPQAELTWGRRWEAADTELALSAVAGAAFGELPRQELYLIGGRGTLSGYDFRSFGGDRFALVDLTASTALWHPWLRARALAAVGWAGVGGAGEDALALWGAESPSGPRASVGVGVGIVHDILHVDVARGLGTDGRWELVIEASPAFWDFL